MKVATVSCLSSLGDPLFLVEIGKDTGLFANEHFDNKAEAEDRAKEVNEILEKFFLRFGSLVREELKRTARKSIEEHNHDLDIEYDMDAVSLTALLEKMEAK